MARAWQQALGEGFKGAAVSLVNFSNMRDEFLEKRLESSSWLKWGQAVLVAPAHYAVRFGEISAAYTLYGIGHLCSASEPREENHNVRLLLDQEQQIQLLAQQRLLKAQLDSALEDNKRQTAEFQTMKKKFGEQEDYHKRKLEEVEQRLRHSKPLTIGGYPVSEDVFIQARSFLRQISYDKTKVYVGVCGASGEGKSTFINSVRGLGPGDPNAAPTATQECTMEVTTYQDPNLPNLVWVDVPGSGTAAQGDAMTYFVRNGIFSYDILLVVHSGRLRATEVACIHIAANMKGQPIPAFVLRTRTDELLKNYAKAKGKSGRELTRNLEFRKESIKALRDDSREDLKRNLELIRTQFQHDAPSQDQLPISDEVFLINEAVFRHFVGVEAQQDAAFECAAFEWLTKSEEELENLAEMIDEDYIYVIDEKSFLQRLFAQIELSSYSQPNLHEENVSTGATQEQPPFYTEHNPQPSASNPTDRQSEVTDQNSSTNTKRITKALAAEATASQTRNTDTWVSPTVEDAGYTSSDDGGGTHTPTSTH